MHNWGKIKTEVDLTEGSVAKNMIVFAIPVIISSWVELSFNLADYIVCGHFVSDNAVGAIGATSSLSALVVDLFIGFAVGVNVVISNALGSKNKERAERAIGTSALMAIVFGVLLAIVSSLFAKSILQLMKTPDEILDMSTAYLRIYFAGIPFLLLYNFGAAALRGMGDTVKPFLFLTFGGILNVGLNFLLVVPVKMGVSGLAIATISSEAISAFLVYLALFRNKKGFAPMRWKNLRFYKVEALEILKIGIPAGLQTALFDITNVLIQSNVNGFGTNTISGDSAANRISSYVYNAMDAFAQATIAFIAAGQGAKDKKRIKDSLKYGLIYTAITWVIVGGLVILLRRQLLQAIISNEEAISVGEINLLVIQSTYILMGTVNVLAGAERGLGKSLLPAIVSFLGISVVRIVYVYTLFQISELHTMNFLYLTYPLSWLITAIAHSITAYFVFKKEFEKLDEETAESNKRSA